MTENFDEFINHNYKLIMTNGLIPWILLYV